jgi:hypothetical protein
MKPNVCVNITESRIRTGREESNIPPPPDKSNDVDVVAAAVAALFNPILIIPELFETTPPHISDTSNTLAKGVHRDTLLHTRGRYSFNMTPSVIGANTTLAHATHNAIPLTGIAFPTIIFVNSGVTALANRVLHAVKMTLNATSAPAINVTKLEAVPPGEQPTNTSPKNKCFPNWLPVTGST